MHRPLFRKDTSEFYLLDVHVGVWVCGAYVCVWLHVIPLLYRVARVEQTETPQMMEKRVKNCKEGNE